MTMNVLYLKTKPENVLWRNFIF